MGLFADYLEGVAMRKNPALLQQKLATNQANQMAAMAEQIYGSRGQAAQFEQQQMPTEGPMMPSQTRQPMAVNQQTQVATPGSGMFDEAIPMDQRQMLMNKRMLGSGISGFMDQWRGNQGRMQDSRMQNLGSMARQQDKQRYEQANPKRTTMMQNVAASLADTSPEAFRKGMAKQLSKSGGVNINMGASESKLNFATPAQVKQLGYAPGTQVLIDKNNKPYMPPGMAEATAKNRSFISMMDESDQLESDVAAKYPDFEPTETVDAMLRQLQAGGSTAGSIIAKMQSPASKSYMTSQMNWIAANRGALSGAAVPEIEVARDLQTYYPQAGDPPELQAFKRRLRQSRRDAIASTTNLPEDARREALSASADADAKKVEDMAEAPSAETSANKPGQPLSFEEWKKAKAQGLL